MKYFNMFANRQPYLDADDGTDIGGGTNDTNTDSNVIDLFSDDDNSDNSNESMETNTDESTDTNTDTTGTDANVDQQKQGEQLYEVKYNGEIQKLSMQDLVTNAQKGLNYSKVLEQKQALENSKEFEVLDYYAKMQGMTREQYTDFLIESKEKQAVKSEVEAVKSKYSDIPDELAEEIAQIRLEQNKSKLAEKQANEEKQKQESQQKQYMDFLSEYPDVTADKIPQEVWNMVAQGKDLLTAYTKWDNQQLKIKLQTVEQNNKNKTKSIGSVTGDGISKDTDTFLKELFS